MLTRLQVSGFKNLVNTEIHFGPFTCIAGFNGVGKSNIFDAIHFLSRLADQPFVEAARGVRGGADVVELFTAGGDERMTFECDIVIPSRGVDDFHQPAEASQTFLSYRLVLRLRRDEAGLPRVELEDEGLEYIPRGQAKERLGFPHSDGWRESVALRSPRRASFIETEDDGGERVVRLSSDKMRDEDKTKRGGGRPAKFLARTLPRTVLSAAQNADESRTAVLVRSEMRSWRILQLEPSALRQPDDFQAPARLGADGRHLPATLYRLAVEGDPERVYAEIANRLAELVEDVRRVRVERDDARRLLRLVMADRDGVELPASSLSDGTLRFVALSVLAIDPSATGVVCLEEPENGIHPNRMGAMVRLLMDMASDTESRVDEDNPLRQVIVSTHSPIVAARVSSDALVFADHRDAEAPRGGAMRSLVLRPIEGTWRGRGGGVAPVARGGVLGYLGAVRPDADDDGASAPDSVYHFAEQLGLPFTPP
ncbi:MAG: AAA family ATPase [Sandaracinaceae bacterium]|nr:AAA family ATPase [Sandaracinaceae bacterium]